MGARASVERDDSRPNVPGQDSPWRDWVSPSATVNFCCDDPILDWLEAFGEAKGFTRDDQCGGYDARTDFRIFLRRKAADFERIVRDHLAARFQVVPIARNPVDVRDRAFVDTTWAAMR